MKSFYLAIEPPAHDVGRLSLLMRRLGDPSPLPHVTVVEPPRLSSDLSWLGAVSDVIAHTRPFAIEVKTPRTFGDRVLYLAVDAPQLTDLRRRLLAVIERLGDESHSDDTPPYVPHLTLSIARQGHALPSYDKLDPLLVKADAFEATELTLFRRDDAQHAYRAWRRFPLSPT